MKTSRRGYLMALVAGSIIIGAATAGVALAQPEQQSATDTTLVAPSAAPSSDLGSSVSIPAPSPGSTAPSTPLSPSTGPTSASARSAAPSSGASGAAPSGGTKSTSSSAPSATTTSATTTTTAATVAPKFKDGQYAATATYDSPGGPEKLGVTLNLAADKVTAVKLDLLGGAGISHSYQMLFESGYMPMVVGKDISTIKLGAVAGSSLTGDGFNKALAQIEDQAHV